LFCIGWKNDFMSFYNWSHANGYGDNLTIDRINNDKGYSPENCRWATKTEQSINQRMKKSNTSGYVGVCFHKQKNKWVATIKYKGKSVLYKYFSNKQEAIKYRDAYIIDKDLPHKLSKEY